MRDNREVWESLGRDDPDWAVLTAPERRHGGWSADEGAFLASGRTDVAAALALLPDPASGRALDFGCGSGRLTLALAERFEVVTAVDISPGMLALTAERAAARHASAVRTVHVDDLEPAADHDLVLSLLVLQHLPSRASVRAALIRLGACLRPGGQLVVEVPESGAGWRQRVQPRSLLFRLGRRAGVPPARLHTWGLSGITMLTLPAPWVREALSAAGLEVVARHERPDHDYTYARWVAPPPVSAPAPVRRLLSVAARPSRPRRPTLVVLCHVDWRWIRQRPQHLADGLAGRGWRVVVLYVPNLRRRQLVARSRGPATAIPLVRLPLARHRAVRAANALVARSVVRATLATCRPDAVWVTWPSLVGLLPPGRPLPPVVYDAMDLAEHLAGDEATRTAARSGEERLLRDAALVLASSQAIADHLQGGAPRREVVVVRNAAPASLRLADEPPQRTAHGEGVPLRLLYAGTVGRWFDVAGVLAALDADEAVTLDVWGPVEQPLPAHPRLRHRGIVAHDDLPRLFAAADALVMPFRRDPIVLGVDPVKLYEYLAARRPVLAPRYPEVERFEGLVHLYGEGGLTAAVATLRGRGDGLLAPREDVRRFLAANSWDRRLDEVERDLHRLRGRRPPPLARRHGG